MITGCPETHILFFFLISVFSRLEIVLVLVSVHFLKFANLLLKRIPLLQESFFMQGNKA